MTHILLGRVQCFPDIPAQNFLNISAEILRPVLSFRIILN